MFSILSNRLFLFQGTKQKDLIFTQSAQMNVAQAKAAKSNYANQTEELVQLTQTLLKLKFKENGKKPIDYFQFVLHPSNFGTTVENIFHVSFLIKEGNVSISLNYSRMQFLDLYFHYRPRLSWMKIQTYR